PLPILLLASDQARENAGVALDVHEVIVREGAHNPVVVLVVATTLDRAEPATGAGRHVIANRGAGDRIEQVAVVVSHSAAAATTEIAAGPAVGHRSSNRSLGVGTGRKVSRRGRSRECRNRG